MIGKYIVVFNDYNGKVYIKNKLFSSLIEADEYKDSIDDSREPVILPYIEMSPRGEEFTCDDHDKIAKLIYEVYQTLLWGYSEVGAAPVATCHVMQALNHLQLAEQSFKLAALNQAREVASR